MKHVLLDSQGYVIQQDKTGKKPSGFIEAPDHVLPGYKKTGKQWVAPKPDLPDYKILRQIELSKIDGEGMDAMRKAIEQLASFLVTDLPPEYVEYADKVAAIKARHPKGGGA